MTSSEATSDAGAQARRLAIHCAAYRGADNRRGLVQLVTTAAAFLALCAAMQVAVAWGYWGALLLALPAGGFLTRLFIIQHDCGHGSFLAPRRANDWLGRALAIVTLTPYALWRRAHALHHATSGNLDRRGTGDIDTLTIREYYALSRSGRIRYRLYRHPLILIAIGAPIYFLLLQRLPLSGQLPLRDTWASVASLNLAIVIVYGGLMSVIGAGPFLLAYLPVVLVGSWAGVWLFFVQHQFEDTAWDRSGEWDARAAALASSSYYVLPRILRWFTGNIGLHHVHHLCSAIPNYRLQECLDASDELATMNRLTLAGSLRCVRLALWDEDARKLVGFREARRSPAAAASAA